MQAVKGDFYSFYFVYRNTLIDRSTIAKFKSQTIREAESITFYFWFSWQIWISIVGVAIILYVIHEQFTWRFFRIAAKM